MDYKAFLIKYGEIGVKGKNRFRFEDALVTQMHYALDPVGEFKIRKESGRIFAEALSEYDYDEAEYDYENGFEGEEEYTEGEFAANEEGEVIDAE